jgi:hypothetical protein
MRRICFWEVRGIFDFYVELSLEFDGLINIVSSTFTKILGAS